VAVASSDGKHLTVEPAIVTTLAKDTALSSASLDKVFTNGQMKEVVEPELSR